MDINEKIQSIYDVYFKSRVECIEALNNKEINKDLGDELGLLSLNLYIALQYNSKKAINENVNKFDKYLTNLERRLLIK